MDGNRPYLAKIWIISYRLSWHLWPCFWCQCEAQSFFYGTYDATAQWSEHLQLKKEALGSIPGGYMRFYAS